MTSKEEAQKRISNEINACSKNYKVIISEKEAAKRCLDVMERNYEAVRAYNSNPEPRISHLEKVENEFKKIVEK